MHWNLQHFQVQAESTSDSLVSCALRQGVMELLEGIQILHPAPGSRQVHNCNPTVTTGSGKLACMPTNINACICWLCQGPCMW